MHKLYYINSSQRISLNITDLLGSGAEGDVYKVESLGNCVAKIYRPPNIPPREKLQAMLARPPESLCIKVSEKIFYMLAWPTHFIENSHGELIGFLMPEIPFNHAVKLSKYSTRLQMQRSLSPDDNSLPRRVWICRNLAAVIAELHRQDHYVVDLKPENIYLFKDTGIVCLVDNDSFSIAAATPSGPRFPATVFSPEYIAPELLINRLSPQSVTTNTQDNFALAIIIFQVLNNGIHPFQGIPKTQLKASDSEWNIDICVEKGYYAYGLQPHAAIAPNPASTHEYWANSTRELFDRAFASHPNQRPTAEEWRNHLEWLHGASGIFTRCIKKPDDVKHIHFSGMPCPECKFDNPPDRQPPSVFPPPPPSPSPPELPGPSRKLKFAYTAATISLAAAAIFWVNHSSPPSPVPAPTPVRPPQVQLIQPPPPPPPVVAQSKPISSNSVQIAAARNLSQSDDEQGITARLSIIRQAVAEAVDANRSDAMNIMRTAAMGDDSLTLALAQSRMRNVDYLQRFSDWKRMRKEARLINKEVLDTYKTNLEGAIHLQSKALALDPFDREISGNLAYYLALQGNNSEAMRIALYGLSLPRKDSQTGRSNEWNLLGAIYAVSGELDKSQGAYFTSLAITPNLSGLCKSLLIGPKDFGPSLKPSIEVIYKRIFERGQSTTDNCQMPPAWIE